MTKAKALTGKQELWLKHYLGESRLNATDAARRAGYKDPDGAGLVNRRNAVLRARIDAELEKRAPSAPEIVGYIADVATADWKHFLLIRTNPKTGEVMEVKMDLNAKMKALELLGKHHQLFTDKVNVTGDFLDVLKAFGRGEHR